MTDRVGHQAVVLVGGGAFVWWAFYAPEGIRSTIEEMAAPVTGFIGSAFGWLQDKISSKPSLSFLQGSMTSPVQTQCQDLDRMHGTFLNLSLHLFLQISLDMGVSPYSCDAIKVVSRCP